MPKQIVIKGHYADRQFTTDEPLPDAEGPAELVVIPTAPSSTGSIFDLFGKATNLRSEQDIAAQIRDERHSWGEP